MDSGLKFTFRRDKSFDIKVSQRGTQSWLDLSSKYSHVQIPPCMCESLFWVLGKTPWTWVFLPSLNLSKKCRIYIRVCSCGMSPYIRNRPMQDEFGTTILVWYSENQSSTDRHHSLNIFGLNKAERSFWWRSQNPCFSQLNGILIQVFYAQLYCY